MSRFGLHGVSLLKASDWDLCFSIELNFICGVGLQKYSTPPLDLRQKMAPLLPKIFNFSQCVCLCKLGRDFCFGGEELWWHVKLEDDSWFDKARKRSVCVPCRQWRHKKWNTASSKVVFDLLSSVDYWSGGGPTVFSCHPLINRIQISQGVITSLPFTHVQCAAVKKNGGQNFANSNFKSISSPK